MDILILNWKDVKNPEAGGAEIIAFELAKRLVKDGNSVTFFSRSFPGAPSDEMLDGIKIIRKGGIVSVYLHAYFYYRRLRQKPDRVIEMINTICWFTPFYIAKDKRCAYLNQLANEVWYYEFILPLAVFGYIFERIEYLFYKTTQFICYSKSTKDDLIGYGIPSENIFIFRIGIDHKRYVSSSSKNKDPLFIFVARLVPMKRADLCVQAMQYVVKKCPEAQLAIIGRGKLEIPLEKYVKKHNLSDQVTFVTKNNFFISKNVNDSKVKLMQKAWALVLPSIKEGWGLVVTEAGACATPAIVSNVTGLKDSVIANKTGIILSNRPTPQELANAMLQLIENKSLRQSLSINAHQYAQEFTWERSYQEFKRIILR